MSFRSNIKPSKFGKKRLTEWECGHCGHQNRDYMLRCAGCGQRRGIPTPRADA